MTLTSIICSNCGKKIQSNDSYCSICGKLNKQSIIQSQFENKLFNRFNYLAILSGFTFVLLINTLNEVLSIFSPSNFNISQFVLYNILNIVLSISSTYLIVDYFFIELPKTPIKQLIITNYLFVLIGVFLALIFEIFIVIPILNTVTLISEPISLTNDFIAYILNLFILCFVIALIDFLVFYDILYLIQIKHDFITKKLPFRSLLSSELLRLSFVLGLIMGFFSLLNNRILNSSGSSSLIMASISLGSTTLEIILLIAMVIFYFKKYDPEIWQFRSKTFLIFNVLLIYLGRISISVISFILPFNQPSIDLIVSLENDFNTAIIVWLILIFVIFIKEIYQTEPKKSPLSKSHQMIST